MPRYLTIITINLLWLTVFSMPAIAEFYQYVDSKGITHYTDNPTTIPIQYQAQINYHQITFKNRSTSTRSHHGFSGSENIIDATDETTVNLKGYHASGVGISALAELQKILLQKKQALNEKYELLLDEKQTLEKRRQDIEDEKQAAAYNRHVKDVNEKIRQFKKEETRFMVEVERYNTSIDRLGAQ